MKFGFHYINDKDREIIKKLPFPTKEQAEEAFAEIKKLKLDIFKKIYKVVLISEND